MSAAPIVEAVDDSKVDDHSKESATVSTRRRWWLIGFVLVTTIAAVLFASGILSGRVHTDDAFVDMPIVYVSGEVTGRVVEILVAEHQRVEQGEALLRLDETDFELALKRADATLSLANNRTVQARAAAAAADAERKAATAELWRTERELTRVESLHASHSTSQSAFDKAQALRDGARAHVRSLELQAEAELALLLDDAEIRQAEADQKNAQLQLSRTVVRAPISGVVGRRSIEVGTVVSRGRPLLALVADQQVSVMANFKETELAGVRVGSPAEITIDAFPGVVWSGRVESFSPATGTQYALISPEPAAGNFTKVVQRIPIKIALDAIPKEGEAPGGAGLQLAAGLSAEVYISVE